MSRGTPGLTNTMSALSKSDSGCPPSAAVIGLPVLALMARIGSASSAAERLSVASENPAYRSALLGVSLLELDVSILNKLSEQKPDQLIPASQEEFQSAITTLALRSLLAAIYRSPGYADAYAYLGQIAICNGNTRQARSYFREGLKRAPGDLAGHG